MKRVNSKLGNAVIRGVAQDRDDHWVHAAAIADGVFDGHEWALTELYQRMLLMKGKVFTLVTPSFLLRWELDDLLHDIYIVAVRQLQRERMREPGRLMGFLTTLLTREVNHHMARHKNRWAPTADLADLEKINQRHFEGCTQRSISVTARGCLRDSIEAILEDDGYSSNPLAAMIEREDALQKQARIRSALAALKPRDREILIRFYIKQQPAEQIRTEMGGLTETQYRLRKSRAKARLGNFSREQGRA